MTQVSSAPSVTSYPLWGQQSQALKPARSISGLWQALLGLEETAPELSGGTQRDLPQDRGTTALTRDIQEALASLRRMQIQIPEPTEVSGYLLQFPSLIALTLAVAGAAQEGFPEAQLVLEVYQDPEAEDEFLVLNVRLREYDESVMRKIRNVREKFSDQLASAAGWLLLTTDFQPAE